MKRLLWIAALASLTLLASAVGAWSFHTALAAPLKTPAPVRSALSDRSVYQLASGWVSEQGQDVELIDLGGKFAIVAMVFTSCPSVCPTLVKDLQTLERSLPPALQADVRFVLVSIDPDRDTPQVLRRYAERMGLDPVRWTLLRGRADDVRELSAVLGVAYGKTDTTSNLTHSKLVTVLNRQGEVLHQQAGVRDDPERLVSAIESAIAAETGS